MDRFRRHLLPLFLGLSLIGFAGFYLFSWMVRQEMLKQFSFNTTVRLQDNAPARLDEVWEDLGFFVSPALSVVGIGLLTLLGMLVGRGKRGKAAALLIPILFGVLILAEVFGKARVESPAPPFFMLKNPTTIFPTYHVQEEYSYPSGHAARSLYSGSILLILLYHRLKRYLPLYGLLGAGVAGFVLAVSLGKVILGQHWMADIIGGWILAAACIFPVAGMWFRSQRAHREE